MTYHLPVLIALLGRVTTNFDEISGQSGLWPGTKSRLHVPFFCPLLGAVRVNRVHDRDSQRAIQAACQPAPRRRHLTQTSLTSSLSIRFWLILAQNCLQVSIQLHCGFGVEETLCVLLAF